MSQPKWKYLDTIRSEQDGDGDEAVLVFIDETGVYPPEMDIVQWTERDVNYPDEPFVTTHTVLLEQCTYQDGVLSDNKYHPDHPAWFANDIHHVAAFVGHDTNTLISALVSADPVARAWAYLDLAEYHGVSDFDQYPDYGDERFDLSLRDLRVLFPAVYARRGVANRWPEMRDAPDPILRDWLIENDDGDGELIALADHAFPLSCEVTP